MLGRSAAITTTSALSATMAASASAATHAPDPASASSPAHRPRNPRARSTLGPSNGASRKGRAVASPDMLSAATIPLRRTEGPPKRALETGSMSLDSDRLDVSGLGALLALLRVVGDLGPLLQRAIALAVDARVMHEQVLVAVVGGNETEPLVVAEPLYGASWHGADSSTVCACCYAEDAAQSFDLRALALLSPVLCAGQTPRP